MLNRGSIALKRRDLHRRVGTPKAVSAPFRPRGGREIRPSSGASDYVEAANVVPLKLRTPRQA